jgi:hypothetical protein
MARPGIKPATASKAAAATTVLARLPRLADSSEAATQAPSASFQIDR